MNIELDDREFDTVLAALSLWMYLAVPDTFPGIDPKRLEELKAMTMEHGPALSALEIDNLAQRMNISEGPDPGEWITLGEVATMIVSGAVDVESARESEGIVALTRGHYELSETEWMILPTNVQNTLITLMFTKDSRVPLVKRTAT
jgi:hypothetical protein